MIVLAGVLHFGKVDLKQGSRKGAVGYLDDASTPRRRLNLLENPASLNNITVAHPSSPPLHCLQPPRVKRATVLSNIEFKRKVLSNEL
jgi:hypothetical protein